MRMNLGVDMVAAVSGPSVKIAKPMWSQSSRSVMRQTLTRGDPARLRLARALPTLPWLMIVLGTWPAASGAAGAGVRAGPGRWAIRVSGR
ncbi:hypothetical protein GCM10018953_19410 [Streptosporangium nondiastaticum]